MSLGVLMLSWEYPPDHVGGLGRHVASISRALHERGVHVTVLTRRGAGRPEIWDDGGVRVISAKAYDLHPPDFPTWAAEFNVSLLEEVLRMLSPDEFDIIHAHDWIVAYASRALKHAWNLPLVATIHATECGRQKGLHNPVQAHISETEWWLCYEAWRVIACSDYMRREICQTFSVPDDKVRVIPNGISPSWFEVERNPQKDPLVLYVGRLVPEKGAHVLVEAMSDIALEFPSVKLVVAGSGPMEGDLRRRIWESGLGRVVDLPGHLGDEALKDLYARAWVACFPSSYEPFGIVALEAMATGVPCVVGDAGGLQEIIDHGVTGMKVIPDDPVSLGETIKVLLRDTGLRLRLASRAKAVAKRNYSWDDIARSSEKVYEEVRALSRREMLPSILKAGKAAFSNAAGDSSEPPGQ
jgi:glycogen(starch) synthase